MLFEIVHRTDYRYGRNASEAYIESRLTPPTLPTQTIVSHTIDFSPNTPVSTYTDYFGNQVTFYSMTLRHERLSVVNKLTVRTHETSLPGEALRVNIAEARQLVTSKLTDVFDYLQPTAMVPTGGMSMEWARRYFPVEATLGVALEELNRAIFQKFTYKPGSTSNSTPLATVWKQKAGVCQDFSHIMLSVLRTAGIPARYVCGYIETDPVVSADGKSTLIGATATHAWVEALVPGGYWVALDPTNDQWCGQRHVTMAYGRDFGDASPVRGTFKGSGANNMSVKVYMKRVPDKS
ncbi:transglutaminase family protein [soil metagenome]